MQNNPKALDDKIRQIQELRRSSAAQPQESRNKRRKTRLANKQAAIEDQK